MRLGIDSLLNILNQNNIDYWLDSGTLLGLKRDGKLISGDKDIDISVLDCERVFSLLQGLGDVDIRTKKLRGQIVKIKIFGLNERVIDISFFYDTGKNFYISPQFIINYEHFLLNSTLIKKILVSYLYRAKSIDYKILIFFKIILKGYWLTPKNLICVDKIKPSKDVNYKMPLKVEEYLTYRYGNWQKKISNWSSTKQDNGLYFFD